MLFPALFPKELEPCHKHIILVFFFNSIYFNTSYENQKNGKQFRGLERVNLSEFFRILMCSIVSTRS